MDHFEFVRLLFCKYRSTCTPSVFFDFWLSFFELLYSTKLHFLFYFQAPFSVGTAMEQYFVHFFTIFYQFRFDLLICSAFIFSNLSDNPSIINCLNSVNDCFIIFFDKP